jgi:NAD(P)-dependent dehydrogenase (short-subunit alcohol dehydrogenase family)
MSDRFSVRGKKTIVTGASSGLGKQFALTLAEEGATVVLASRRMEILAELESEIRASGGEAHAIVLDVSRRESIESAIAESIERMGRIDVLVNNSGVVIHKPLLAHTEDDWDDVTDVNLKGAWLMAQAVAKTMVEGETGGSIINIASIIGGGRTAMQIPEYVASKGGLIELTKAMGAELARFNVRVNALAPGYIETDFNREFLRSEHGQRLIRGIPQRRAGLPAELDGALLLLASDASTFMTGTVVRVDGGHCVTSV